MAKRQEYGNDSIYSLKGADRIRKRPAVVFGSDGVEGCEHAIFEIISNAIDEARAGYGDRILITRYLDGSVEVEDFGRGCPVDYNQKEQRYNWELLFCELYAGGKYDAAENYEYSLGLNGLGLCATQYASEWMEAEICRDGYLYRLRFERGENVGGLQREATARKKTGSRVRWKPDREVFTDTAVPEEWYADTVKRQAVVNAGLLFILKSQKPGGGYESAEVRYENGIADYVKELAGEGPSLTGVQFWQGERTGRDREDKPDYKVKIQAACCFSNRVKVIEYYHNSSWLEHGGSPEKAVKSAFVSQIDAYIKNAGKYLKNESRIGFQDVEDCLVLITSSFSSQTSYENQTKKSVTNKFVAEAMTDFLKHQLEVYFIENPDDAARVAEQVLINKRSRENAERTRLNLKKKLAGTIDMTNRVEKFVDCRTKDIGRREIYIVEGDSALGACKQSRDADFQAIIPVRGKILNCLKADYDKIFKSDIITDLIKVLGCGVEVKTKANKEFSTFDLDSLRWNKIIICTDADVDGFQIRTLILTMLYRLTPSLIEEGFVYIAESPLYEIVCGDQSYFAWTDDEKDRVVQKLGGKKMSVQRSKGLGENEPDMMWLTTMNPETRRLIKIMPSETQATADKFDLLLGDNLAGRKDYIAENGYLYLDDMDLS